MKTVLAIQTLFLSYIFLYSKNICLQSGQIKVVIYTIFLGTSVLDRNKKRIN